MTIIFRRSIPTFVSLSGMLGIVLSAVVINLISIVLVTVLALVMRACVLTSVVPSVIILIVVVMVIIVVIVIFVVVILIAVSISPMVRLSVIPVVITLVVVRTMSLVTLTLTMILVRILGSWIVPSPSVSGHFYFSLVDVGTTADPVIPDEMILDVEDSLSLFNLVEFHESETLIFASRRIFKPIS